MLSSLIAKPMFIPQGSGRLFNLFSINGRSYYQILSLEQSSN
jgi:hypothetical protein